MTEFTTPMPTAKESVSRLRTIKQCLAYIKELDADTAVTEHFIRTLCRSGKVLYYASGSKSLVSLDSLLAYLNVQSRDKPTARSKYFDEGERK